MTKISNFAHSDSILEELASRKYFYSGETLNYDEHTAEEIEALKLESQEIMARNGFRVVWINSAYVSKAFAKNMAIC